MKLPHWRITIIYIPQMRLAVSAQVASILLELLQIVVAHKRRQRQRRRAGGRSAVRGHGSCGAKSACCTPSPCTWPTTGALCLCKPPLACSPSGGQRCGSFRDCDSPFWALLAHCQMLYAVLHMCLPTGFLSLEGSWGSSAIEGLGPPQSAFCRSGIQCDEVCDRGAGSEGDLEG